MLYSLLTILKGWIRELLGKGQEVSEKPKPTAKAQKPKKPVASEPPPSGQDEEDFAPMPQVPSTPTIPKFGGGGGLGQTVVVAIIVCFVMIMGMSIFGKGGFFVNKADFTANMVGLVAVMEQAESDLAKVKADAEAVIGGLSDTIASQVSTAVSQSVSGWSSQLSSLSDRITQLSSDVSGIQSGGGMGDVSAQLASLQTDIAELQSDVDDALARIEDLEESEPPDSSGTSVAAEGVTITAVPYDIGGIYYAEARDYNFTLTIVNETTPWKKVYIGISGVPSEAVSGMELVDVSSANFSALVTLTTTMDFTTTMMPASGVDCLRISAVSDDYLTLLAPGTTTVQVILSYEASEPYMWDFTFSPVVVEY